MPVSAIVRSARSLIARVARRPQKYVQRTFWKQALSEGWDRGRAGAIYALPSLLRKLRKRPRMRVYVFPSPMNRYQFAETYLAWKTLWTLDADITTTEPERADFALAWNPSTSYELEQSAIENLGGIPVINARCTDIRKSTVDRCQAEAFGYSLAIDPLTYTGTILRKSEKNGTHDAVLLAGPLSGIEPGYVYQRLVDFPSPRGMVEWRLFIVGGKPVIVYRRYCPVNNRFRDFMSAPVEMVEIEREFSESERGAIVEFNRLMGLDFGALDVLRDASDGRLYICDCNNTPTGPASKLSLRNRLTIVRQIATAFDREYLAPLRAARGRY